MYLTWIYVHISYSFGTVCFYLGISGIQYLIDVMPLWWHCNSIFTLLIIGMNNLLGLVAKNYPKLP